MVAREKHMLPCGPLTTLPPPQEVYKTVSMRLNIVSPDLSGEWGTALEWSPDAGGEMWQ